jgi:hypothetical protein
MFDWKDIGIRTAKTFVMAVASALLVTGFGDVNAVQAAFFTGLTTAGTFLLNIAIQWANSK